MRKRNELIAALVCTVLVGVLLFVVGMRAGLHDALSISEAEHEKVIAEIDFSNLCPKRDVITSLSDQLIRLHPEHLFTADDIEVIRQTLIENGQQVPCGGCFVEERRQRLGEIANEFIEGLRGNTELKPKTVAALKNWDGYIPTPYDLITYDGLKQLSENHPAVANAFTVHNNARGMQSGRLIEGRAEYNREILKYTDKQVEQKNSHGGLRVFSYSDLELQHLLDIVQVVEDSAVRKLAIQGYTKNPLFALLVKDTGLKVNRSHIPSGIGYDSDRRLTFDPVEGINFNDKYFFDASNSDSVGNNVIGINDDQIRIAMADDYISQIIGFHTSLSKEIRDQKKIGHWENYKNFQTDKVSSSGTVAEKQINFYTDVLQAAQNEGKPIKTNKDFVEKFLSVAKENGLKPRFWQFLNTNSSGKYIFTPGYEKFLVDFKMFDSNGNYLPQKPVVPEFNDELITSVMKAFAEEKKNPSSEDNKILREVENRLGLSGNGVSVKMSTKGFKNSRYTYDELIKKDPVRIVKIEDRDVPTKGKTFDKKKIAEEARSSSDWIEKYGRKQSYVYIQDIAENVLISTSGVQHGILGNKTNSSAMNTAIVSHHLPEILRNSVSVNVKRGREKDGNEFAYLTFGYGEDAHGSGYIVKSTINHFKDNRSIADNIEIYNVLKGSKARKTEAYMDRGLTSETDAPPLIRRASDTITVADLLEIVKDNYPEILPENVADHFGIEVEREPDLMFSQSRSTDLEKLQKENARLKKQVEYWQGQTKATNGWKADPKQETRETKRILNSVSSKADEAEMTKRITKLHEDLSNGKYTYEEGKSVATEIASDIVAKSEALVSKDMETYREARKIVKSAPTVKSAYEQLQRLMGTDVFPDYRSDESRQNQIDEVMDSLRPFVDNPYDLGKAVIIDAVADDIIDTGMNVSAAKPTPVDIERAKTAEAKAEGKRAVENQKLADEMFYGRKIAEIRRQRDEKIEKILQHQRDVNAARREMRQEAADREKLRKIVKRLQGKKIDPVTKAMLPDIVKELDATAVNITDKSISNLTELRQWYIDKTTKDSDIYDPNFIPDKATLRKLERLEKAMKGMTIGQMDIVQVRELTEILQNIEHQANEARKFQQSKLKIDNYEAGLRTIQDIENARPGKINRELSPQRAARRMAGYNDGAIEGTEASPLITLVDETVEGERKADIYQRTALHRLSRWLEDKDFMRNLYGRRAERIMITGVDARTGETRNVAITPAMRISLYLHSKNDDNMRHIQEGGVVIPGERNYRAGKMAEAYAEDIRIKLTKTNVNRIVSGMSAKERSFADAIWRYFNEYAPQRLNEASVLIDGYEKFNEENYFPISVDKNFLSQDYESVIMEEDGSLTHPGFGEERIQSAKPIYLRDVNDVFMTAVRTNAMYACQAVPLMNLAKLVNVQQKGATDSVTAAMNRRFTAAKTDPINTSASEYLAKYMRDYAGNRGGKKSGLDKMLSQLRSNYSGGVLTLAAGTAIKQAASYPTAAAVVSTRALASAMNPARTVDVSFIDEMTAAFTKRTEGLSTVELAEMTQEGKTIPRALNWIQAVDVGTTALLKRAAAIEVQITTDLRIGSPEYKKAVTDMYIRIIEQTQPNYSIALRPDILRSDSALERALVMFATQPMQNFGILYDAIGNYQAKRQAYTNSTNPAAKKAYTDAKKGLGKAVGSQLAASLVFALMQYAYDAFRRKDDKYKDDGETTLLSFAKGIGINMLSNGAGMFIAGKVALELGETITDKIVKAFGGESVFNTSVYGFEVAELEAITNAASSAINAAGTITSELYKVFDGSKETSVNIENLARKTWTAAEDALLLFGIPLENATTTLTSVAKIVCTASMGKYLGGYYAIRISTDPSSSKKPFYDNLYNCYVNGNSRDLRRLYNTMLEDGFDADKIKTAMEDRMKDKEHVKSVKDLSHRWVAP